MTRLGPENFIPWEQIEPLIRTGMTVRDLADALLAKLGLPSERYTLATTPG